MESDQQEACTWQHRSIMELNDRKYSKDEAWGLPAADFEVDICFFYTDLGFYGAQTNILHSYIRE
jgi:hypothetical protein